MDELKEKNLIGIGAMIKSAKSYEKMAEGLNSLNTSRGGVHGTKGFVFEELHAADASMKGKKCCVVNNNGPADLVIDGQNVQLKMGYKNNTPKWRVGYEKVVVDKGNTQLLNKAAKAGYEVEESAISSAEAKTLAEALKRESAITGNVTAPFTSTVASSHLAGKAAAGITAKVSVPFQVGANLCDAMTGEKSIEDAVVDTVVDGAATVATAYAGTAALTAASTVVATAGAALAETAVGASAMTAAATAGTALASTAVGGAAVTVATTTASALTAGVAAVASAPVLPVVAITAGLGFIARAFSK